MVSGAYDQISKAAGYTHIVEERPSRSSACSTGHHRHTSGRTQKEWNIPFCTKVVGRRTLCPCFALWANMAHWLKRSLETGRIWSRISTTSGFGSLQRNLFSHAWIRVHGGKTQVWNRSGIRFEGCDALERIAQAADPRARVSHGPRHSRDAFIQAHLDKKAAEQSTLLERFPTVTDLQSAWLIILHCASARANYLLRVVELVSVAAYASAHDECVWTCMYTHLNINPTQDEDIRSCANLPLMCWTSGPQVRCTDNCLCVLGKLA